MKIEDLTVKQREKIAEFGVNTWFVLELLEEYLNDPESVGEDWQKLFSSFNIKANEKRKAEKTAVQEKAIHDVSVVFPQLQEGEEAIPVRGAGERIIENMNSSLAIPTASSLRTIPVKILEENRRIINQYFKKTGRRKISYTHIIGWAIVKAAIEMPVMNNSFAVVDGTPHIIKKKHINLGLAVDIEKKDGSRSLIVPNIKKANTFNFKQFFDAYNEIINRAKNNKIDISDFQGTTITLTNPGTIGTVSSNPRLMTGQGSIIAAGAVGYPAEYQAVTGELIAKLGISKVINITSTYDHRIIQGAESGMFLRKLHELLIGEENFYDEIFEYLQLPVKPVKWKHDNNPEDLDGISNLNEMEKQAKAIQLINMFRVRGHLLANLDPLMHKAQYHEELDPSNYGFTVWDYDRTFISDGLAGLRTATLREILDVLYQTYCDKIGVEYRHIQDPEEKLWLQHRMESNKNIPGFTNEQKKHILYKLIQAENFEKFIDKKYIGHKRFSLEGSETIIPVLDMILNLSAGDNADELILGMAHRGRLNVLANIIGKSMASIFTEFEDIVDTNIVQGSGDVKYHLGAAGIYHTLDDKEIKVSVASNPSHLEFVNPVVEGIVRAKQVRTRDDDCSKIIPVLLHGDAAIAGEGIVAETLNLSQLKGYSTGGTIHIIINNQIGFTTSPVEARSTVYASDAAKMIQAPIFHVNGDDPEAALLVTQLAYEYRMKFKKDVVVDVFSYRKLGHNEADEPAFTQPLLYKAIREHPSVKQIYADKLLKEKTVTDDEAKLMEEKVYQNMDINYERIHKEAKEFKTDLPLALTKKEILELRSGELSTITADDLNYVVRNITEIPKGFSLHPKLQEFIDNRIEFLTKDVLVDWSFAEALAFGTLLLEGIPIRLSGQDSSRGTFSQRHLILADYNTGEEIIPHNFIAPERAIIEPLDSLLSEAAVLGFEFGYSTADPITLVIWEAQFGDFSNAAQVIIDNFITSSFTKWKLPSNLVMLLPHGQEGQGPEHSSARLERFLIMCADNNITISNPSTPVQYYYLLRSQAKYRNRRPLIVMTPKSLLRLPDARSKKDDFVNGKFLPVIDDDYITNKKSIKRVILVSGKFYYDLHKFRKENNREDIALVRIERYYAYPSEEIRTVLRDYSNAAEVVWAQEEPQNMGALNFLVPRLKKDLQHKQKLFSASREESASPAPGSYKVYVETQNKLIKEAFGEF